MSFNDAYARIKPLAVCKTSTGISIGRMRVAAALLAVTMPAAALNPGVALGVDLGTSGVRVAVVSIALQKLDAITVTQT